MEAASAFNINEEEEYELASSAVDQMPPGFRFHPTDSEIVTHYLLNKVIHRRFRAVAIREIDLNKCEPWDLPHKAAKMEENEWFFFFEKESKYPSGTRTNRATASGYWKATGKDREVYNAKNQLVGMKKTLVFYKGRAPKGHKTSWVIHEYRLHGEFSPYNLSHDAKEKWVVCRVFHKKYDANIPLARIDSFLDRSLVDSSTPLPPLTDYSSHLTDQKPSSSFASDEISKPSTLMMLGNNKLHQNNLLVPHLNINGYNQYYSIPHNLNPHDIDSVLSYESPSLAFQHQHGLSSSWCLANFPIKVGDHDDKPNSTTLGPGVYIGGEKPERMCKMEPVSFSNYAISPSRDTGGLTTAADCEKESESNKECEGLFGISDMDSLWSYSLIE